MNKCKEENYRHAHHAECYSCTKCKYGSFYFCQALAQLMFLEAQYRSIQEHKCECGRIMRFEVDDRNKQ